MVEVNQFGWEPMKSPYVRNIMQTYHISSLMLQGRVAETNAYFAKIKYGHLKLVWRSYKLPIT